MVFPGRDAVDMLRDRIRASPARITRARHILNGVLSHRIRIHGTGLRNKKKPLFQEASIDRDPAGARTQDPNIKSVVLYQLSYGIGTEKSVLPQGLEPWTPTLRVSCSTN